MVLNLFVCSVAFWIKHIKHKHPARQHVPCLLLEALNFTHMILLERFATLDLVQCSYFSKLARFGHIHSPCIVRQFHAQSTKMGSSKAGKLKTSDLTLIGRAGCAIYHQT